jgi:hypothetical protein
MVEGPRFDNVTYDLEDDVLVVADGGEDQALVACSTWTGGGTAKHRFTSFSNRAPGTAPCRSASRRTGSPTPPGRRVLPSEPDTRGHRRDHLGTPSRPSRPSGSASA